MLLMAAGAHPGKACSQTPVPEWSACLRSSLLSSMAAPGELSCITIIAVRHSCSVGAQQLAAEHHMQAPKHDQACRSATSQQHGRAHGRPACLKTCRQQQVQQQAA